jgi:type III secretory pathway component EscU
MDHIKKELEEKAAIATLKGLLSVNFSEYVYENWAMLKSLKMIRDKCMQMMNVTEQDMQAFSKQQQIDEEIGSEDSDTLQRLYEEWLKAIDVIEQANAKLAD